MTLINLIYQYLYLELICLVLVMNDTHQLIVSVSVFRIICLVMCTDEQINESPYYACSMRYKPLSNLAQFKMVDFT